MEGRYLGYTEGTETDDMIRRAIKNVEESGMPNAQKRKSSQSYLAYVYEGAKRLASPDNQKANERIVKRLMKGTVV